jgi:hypothetical protein
MSDQKASEKPGFRTRLFAFTALSLLASAVGWIGYQGYRAATDSFVAPIILSPDNDAVLTNKLKSAEMTVERSKASAQLEGIDEDIAGIDQAMAKLRELDRTTEAASKWMENVAAGQSAAAFEELRILEKQKKVLGSMVEQQDALVSKSQANLKAGLISQVDHAVTEQAAMHARASYLETERMRVQVGLAMHQAALARMAGQKGAPPAPDQVVRAEQRVRIELELTRLASERRAKITEKRLVAEKIAKLDEVKVQLEARPVFRALERRMDVAFVPYTQAEGLTEGARVYECVWGLVHCRPVGTVAEIVPGEVVLPDPWGNQSRGHYAVLDLGDRSAARAKTLRVRPSGGAGRAPASLGERVSTR